MEYHIAAFITGFLLDLIIGDPYWLPHPIRLIGSLIAFLDKAFMNKNGSSDKRSPVKERLLGVLMVVIVLLLTLLVTGGIVVAAWHFGKIYGYVVQSILGFYVLAAKSLRVESMKVSKALETGDINASRKAVSMIVGRDTGNLDEAGVARAAVETVAENTSDGVIAPLIYLAIGGPVLAMLYKAVNTMDSMIGYHNDRYEYFGTAAAKLDDAVNYIPARLSALLMIAGTFLASIFSREAYSPSYAWKIFVRDRYNHKSPNSAQTESVCAGALGLRLAGDAFYFGRKVSKPYIGDEIQKIETVHIKRANTLMYITAFLTFFICLAVKAGIYICFG